MSQDMQELNKKVYKMATQSQVLFGQKSMDTMQKITMLAEQMEYMRQQVSVRPELTQIFLKNYNEFCGFLTQSCAINPSMVNPQIMKDQSDKFDRIFNSIKQLQIAVNGSTKKYIIVYSENPVNLENLTKQTYQSFEQIAAADGASNLQYKAFSEDQDLKKFIETTCQQMNLIIVTDATSLFNNAVLEFIYANNKKVVFKVEGLFCLCKQKKLLQLSNSLKDTNLPFSCSSDISQAREYVYNLLNKNKFKRIILLQDFNKYLQFSVTAYLTRGKESNSISLASLGQANFSDILSQASKYIQEKKIAIFVQCWDAAAIKDITESLKKAFYQEKSDDTIAFNLMQLYTKQSPMFKLLNSVMNVLNEQLLKILDPIIFLFYLAWTRVKLQEESLFYRADSPSQFSLFRGTSVDNESIEIYKKNQKLVFPAFSSFTSRLEIAQDFLKNQQREDNTTPVLFELRCKKAENQSFQVPKYLKKISVYKSEEEYLLQMFSLFNIQQADRKPDNTLHVTLEA